MTEPQDAKKDGETVDDVSWRVEGAQSSPSSAEGLGDTVVQMPKIGGGKATSVKPTMGRGKAPVKSTGAPKPSIPKPVKQTRTDDLMAPFDQRPVSSAPTVTASAVPTPVSAPSPRPVVAAPSMAMPTPAVQSAPSAVPMASVVAKPAPRPASGAARRTRKARLRVARVDPWSVMKTVFLFSVAFGIMSWVATYLLWQILLSSGLFAAINDSIVTIISSPNSTDGWRIEDYLSANKVLGITAVLAVINVVITTALGTLGAFLYNLSANILGGLELTLAED